MNGNLARAAVLAGWLVVGYLAFAAEVGGGVRAAMAALFLLLLTVHVAEVFVLAGRLRRAGEPFLPSDLLLTLVFGVFHLRPRLSTLRREGT
jgi:uncharacterized protein YhhL (DUF1145 family)